jgi:hypothetical protein
MYTTTTIYSNNYEGYIVAIERSRYHVIHDGGTHRPASIYDKYGTTGRGKIISIADNDIVYRPILERYVRELNNEYAEYLFVCSQYLNS